MSGENWPMQGGAHMERDPSRSRRAFTNARKGGNVNVPSAFPVPTSAQHLDNLPTDSSPTMELLTVLEVAKLLNISASSVRRLQDARHIPFFKVGGCVRFAKRDVMAYLKNRRVEPIGQ